MARRRTRKQQEQDDTLINLGEAKDQAQGFLEENQNMILAVVLGLLILVGGYFAYKYMVQMPNEEKAAVEMYKVQNLFQVDSFARALEGPGGGNLGFKDIIDQYGGTSSGNLAQYYAGLCYLHLGNFQEAIDHLEDFSAAGSITPAMRYGAIGDAHSELGNADKAISNYKSAAAASPNDFSSPYYLQKLGQFLERQGKKEEAKKAYMQIKDKYPESPQGLAIDKYLGRVGG